MLRRLFNTLDVPHLILRDQNLLPHRSGFDIDVLTDKHSFPAIFKACASCAAEFNIVMMHNEKRMVFFYLDYTQTTRNWAILDLQSSYDYGEQSLNLHDILAIEESARNVLIQNVQAARKGTASKDIQKELGVTPYAKKQETAPAFLQKVKRGFLMRAFFVHLHVMPFIVISGPDGVGKTTLLHNIMRLFASLPFKTFDFHHTGLTKEKVFTVEMKEENMTLLRRLRRRYTPIFVKKLYGAISGEIKYALRINKEILSGFYSGTLVFSDRYIYDRAIKMRMTPDKMQISKITTRINAHLMRKPTVMIIPTDTSEAIYKRKQELQPAEIKRYYDELDHLTQWGDEPHVHKVEVEGKTPESLAIEATAKIIKSLSPLIFHAIGMYEKDLKR
ncbi:MAG: hypothetical protein ACRBDI_06175 [Alphaproteobacteria bacterium]